MARWLQLPCSLLLVIMLVAATAAAADVVVRDDREVRRVRPAQPLRHDVHVRQPAAARRAADSGLLPAAAARLLPPAVPAAGGLPSADHAVDQLPAAAVRRRRLQPDAELQPDARLQPDAVGVVHAAEHAVLPHAAGDALPAGPRLPAQRGGGRRRVVARGGARGGGGGRSLGLVIGDVW
ncbi:hypothetical protein OsJ_00097 [Oryza sativa Japonica Group]|uniref:Uncharacterized protein n=1 Tax=Oryza sativa subsp. japonica TaxID=39947 RepID=A2ZNG5_ORYSJ|nr:hypothetical protein OsJ_00097 [Oryza sativa Japonica Group]